MFNMGIQRNLSGQQPIRKEGFITDEQFWKDEYDSPLLARNLDYVSLENADELCARAREWLTKLKDSGRCNEAFSMNIDFSRLEREPVEEKFCRIFDRDADRTWVPKDDESTDRRSKIRRDVHCNNLKMMSYVIKDYHQGLGYLCAFASLFLGQEDTVRLCTDSISIQFILI